MNDDLKKLGISFSNPALVEEYYARLAGIFVTGLNEPKNGLILDLNSLPVAPFDFKMAVIKWLISVNLPRLEQGLEPILDFHLIRQCPVWRIIKIPLRRVQLTKEGLFNKPKLQTRNKIARSKGINRS